MITLIVAGAPSAAFVPGVLATLPADCRRTVDTIIVTKSARRFVTKNSLEVFSSATVVMDKFGAIDHQALVRASQSIYVYPATYAFVNKVAHGITDTLALMVAQLGMEKLKLYVSVPDGLSDSRQFGNAVSLLTDSGATVCEAPKGKALSSGMWTNGGCPSPQELWNDIVLSTTRGRKSSDS